MIIIPVLDDTDRKLLMMFVTPDALERLRAGHRCTLHTPTIAGMLGVDGVVLRFAEDDAAAAACAQSLSPDAQIDFHIVMRDFTRKPA